MSYARWGEDSQVYVYENCNNKLVCCACVITDKTIEVDNYQAMIEHLKGHQELGHKVPEYALQQLNEANNKKEI